MEQQGGGDKDGGSVMILEMIYSFSSPRLPSFLPTQEDETIEHRRCVNDFAHCLYIFLEVGAEMGYKRESLLRRIEDLLLREARICRAFILNRKVAPEFDSGNSLVSVSNF